MSPSSEGFTKKVQCLRRIMYGYPHKYFLLGFELSGGLYLLTAKKDLKGSKVPFPYLGFHFAAVVWAKLPRLFHGIHLSFNVKQFLLPSYQLRSSR